ncbi:germination-specific N-acetylmuramoyl-L-alanine amidase precursor [Oxobacter pfennigii]|uniref:Germination-specific N-acetylmuramoyl-L-alanine amidase n=1 Tax=Oxobacter pfennigii TaxID=36849 RepID=A0A0P8W7W8_9CLOT|nr:N-acetylmuramoyl-L-alanine amidase [Oxobacter pfennigii]KPU44765.1 germination-specific N-acetylmuramoyl-L-alanine amidase precursor [Oxobacter pfennigii]
MKSIFLVINKKKIIFLILIPFIIAILFSYYLTVVYSEENMLAGKIIVVDAGHGGVDGGANNSYILEKNINLDVALKLQKKLEMSGVKVIMTRTEDVDLSRYGKIDRERYRRDLKARLNLINNSNADMFISIHANSSRSNPSARGIMTYYYNSHPHNKSIANIFQDIFNNDGFSYEGNTYKGNHRPQAGRYYLLAYSKIPGLIIETGFITNKIDLLLLQEEEYRDYLAEVIYKGIVGYFTSRDSLPDSLYF